MRGNTHVRFGGRAGETDQPKGWHRAPVRPHYWAVDALQAAAFDVHLAHPYGMTAMRKRKRVKTDAKDSYELANLLRLGSLPEAYIAPRGLRAIRELVRHRQRLTQADTAVKAGIRGVLAKHTIHLQVADLESGLGTDCSTRCL